MAYRLGKNPPVVDPQTMRFGMYLTPALPPPPASINYGAKVNASSGPGRARAARPEGLAVPRAGAMRPDGDPALTSPPGLPASPRARRVPSR